MTKIVAKGAFSKIGIIGLGLIGGSIAKALQRKKGGVQIASLNRDCPDLQQAFDQKIVDLVFESWEELIAWSDLIILASPLATLPSLAEEIGRCCPCDKQLLVIDVGSVKKEIIPLFEKWTNGKIEFLSTHPMAGKEKWGFSHSDADLFHHCSWIVSPHSKNQNATVKQVGALIESLGAHPAILSPDKHDAQVALISHLPALLSRLLLKFVETQDPEALKIAGPGFHSMTRLAKDNPRMQAEIARLNREELTYQFNQWLAFIRAEMETR